MRMEPAEHFSGLKCAENGLQGSSVADASTSTVISDASATSGKRLDYLSWTDYFMSVACLSAQRSKDPQTQVGACIVNSRNRIVGIGYNGMPAGCSDDFLPWRKNPTDAFEDKRTYVVHAEMNAVVNANSATLEGCRLYSTLFPCNNCAKLIIQSGISSVVYLEDKPDKVEMRASRRLLDLAAVTYQLHQSQVASVTIELSCSKNDRLPSA